VRGVVELLKLLQNKNKSLEFLIGKSARAVKSAEYRDLGRMMRELAYLTDRKTTQAVKSNASQEIFSTGQFFRKKTHNLACHESSCTKILCVTLKQQKQSRKSQCSMD